MEPCCWCTPNDSAVNFLEKYALSSLTPDELTKANNDLCYCIECVNTYHKLRAEVPTLHEMLWKLETSRLISHIEKALEEDKENQEMNVDYDDERGADMWSDLPEVLGVSLSEILQYPYLLLHKRLSELFIEVLHEMGIVRHPCHPIGKFPGIYLLMVHPDEAIRRWAILLARSFGMINSTDFQNLQEALTCLLRVIELDLFESVYVYSPAAAEKGYLTLLPDHLYDASSPRNYWIDICILLMMLDEQAMDMLLLGPGKRSDFLSCIMRAMKEETEGSSNIFWPVLQCFMVILDKLGSKVWGQNFDPIMAFQAIKNNLSYKEEIENVRKNCKRAVLLLELEDVPSSSQMKYEFPQEISTWIYDLCPDYFPEWYEDMKTVKNLLQTDIGQDIQFQNSTFLWFIPYIHSFMNLKDLGTAYSLEVIHHLCSEIEEVPENAESFDHVTEYFVWVLVTILELYLNKKCFNSLWISSENWLQKVVKWAKLPNTVSMPGIERRLLRNSLRSTMTSQAPDLENVQILCRRLIGNILKEGLEDAQIPICRQFFDELNMLCGIFVDWELSPQQTEKLLDTLKHIIWSLWKKSLNPPSTVANPLLAFPLNVEGRRPVNVVNRKLPHLSPPGTDEASQEGPVWEGSMLPSRSTDVQENVSGRQGPGAQNKGHSESMELGYSSDNRPGTSRSLMTKMDDRSDALEKNVGQDDPTSQMTNPRPSIARRLRERIKKSRRRNKPEPETEKETGARSVMQRPGVSFRGQHCQCEPRSMKLEPGGRRKSQEGSRRDTVAGGAGMSFPGKSKSEDNPEEEEQDSEESSTDEMD